MSNTAKNPVKSIGTMFLILDGLKELDGAGVTKLAEHLNIPKSTTHNYLSTLRQEEFVVKHNDVYFTGLRFLEYGADARSRNNVYEIAKPEVNELAESTGNFASLLVEEHCRGVYLHRAEGTRSVQVNPRVGTRIYLHSTALGKAILAHLPDQRLDTVISRHGLPSVTSNTITDRTKLDKELKIIRNRKYAIDNEEIIEGLRCVAAPILNKNKRVVGAISVSGPTNRFEGEYFTNELPKKVLEASNIIELNMAYS